MRKIIAGWTKDLMILKRFYYKERAKVNLYRKIDI